jgi:hypothetical protein
VCHNRNGWLITRDTACYGPLIFREADMQRRGWVGRGWVGRGWLVSAAAAAVIGTVAACGGSGGTGGSVTTPPGAQALGGAPTTPAGVPLPTPAPTTAKPAALTCTQLKNAHLGSASVKFNGYADYIPLLDGIWNGEDGASVSFGECGIGDLDGDGAADGVGSIKLTTGGTGQFYSLAVWRNVSGAPVFAALKDMGDRNPIEKITISGGKATVVYLTRTDDVPLAGLNVRRTAVFKLSGATLVELSHTDAPYLP